MVKLKLEAATFIEGSKTRMLNNLTEERQAVRWRTGEGDRRWLSYNLKGGVSLKEEEGMNILDVSFHDTLADSRRVAPYRDYQSLTMAALSDQVRQMETGLDTPKFSPLQTSGFPRTGPKTAGFRLSNIFSRVSPNPPQKPKINTLTQRIPAGSVQFWMETQSVE